MGYAAVAPEVRRLTTAAAERFSDFGCEVEAVNPGWDDQREAAAMAWNVSYASRNAERYAQRPEWFEPSLVEMIEAGQRVSAVELGLAQLARTEYYHQVRRLFDTYDLLLTPQMPLGAWSVEHRRHPDAVDVRPAAIHLSVQPDGTARRQRAVRIHLRGAAGSAANRRPLARRYAGPAGCGGVRAGGAVGASETTRTVTPGMRCSLVEAAHSGLATAKRFVLLIANSPANGFG